MVYNKGQIDYPIIAFFVLVFGLILLAPIMLKVFNSIQTPMSTQLGNLSGKGGEIAQANYNKIMNTAVNFWDKVIIFAFFIGVILLVVSAIFTQASPFFIILYIIMSFLLVLFAPDIIGSLDNIYNSATFAQESTQLSFINTLRTYFGEFLVGIIVLTGIIIFGKSAVGGRR